MLGVITGALAGLEGALGALGASGAFGGKTGDIGAGIQQIGTDIKEGFQVVKHYFTRISEGGKLNLNSIQTQTNNLSNVILNQTTRISLNYSKFDISKLFFPNEIKLLENALTNFNNLHDAILSQFVNLNYYVDTNSKDIFDFTDNLSDRTRMWGVPADGAGFIASTGFVDGSDTSTRTFREVINILTNIGLFPTMPTIYESFYSSMPWIPWNTTINDLQNIIDILLKGSALQNDLNNLLEKIYQNAIYLITTLSPTKTGAVATPLLPIPAPTLKGSLTEDKTKTLSLLDILIKIGVATLTKTKTEPYGKKRKKRRKKRKRIKKRGRPKKPKTIRNIEMDTNNVSAWIAKISFTFPINKPLNSDDRGTLKFHLKGSGYIIRFVRVKRGTFSVISQFYGTGYKLWGHFWRKRIVNRKVLSWFIKKIKAPERALAIPEEIKDKKVKYN